MNDLAINILRSGLAAAEREFASARDAARRALDEAERYPSVWADVASHAARAAYYAGQITACHDVLIAAGEQP